MPTSTEKLKKEEEVPLAPSSTAAVPASTTVPINTGNLWGTAIRNANAAKAIEKIRADLRRNQLRGICVMFGLSILLYVLSVVLNIHTSHMEEEYDKSYILIAILNLVVRLCSSSATVLLIKGIEELARRLRYDRIQGLVAEKIADGVEENMTAEQLKAAKDAFGDAHLGMGEAIGSALETCLG